MRDDQVVDGIFDDLIIVEQNVKIYFPRAVVDSLPSSNVMFNVFYSFQQVQSGQTRAGLQKRGIKISAADTNKMRLRRGDSLLQRH